MTDRLVFVDRDSFWCDRTTRYQTICCCPRFDSVIASESDNTSYEVIPFLELTREQCKIVADNLGLIIKFAELGRTS